MAPRYISAFAARMEGDYLLALQATMTAFALWSKECALAG